MVEGELALGLCIVLTRNGGISGKHTLVGHGLEIRIKSRRYMTENRRENSAQKDCWIETMIWWCGGDYHVSGLGGVEQEWSLPFFLLIIITTRSSTREPTSFVYYDDRCTSSSG